MIHPTTHSTTHSISQLIHWISQGNSQALSVFLRLLFGWCFPGGVLRRLRSRRRAADAPACSSLPSFSSPGSRPRRTLTLRFFKFRAFFNEPVGGSRKNRSGGIPPQAAPTAGRYPIEPLILALFCPCFRGAVWDSFGWPYQPTDVVRRAWRKHAFQFHDLDALRVSARLLGRSERRPQI